MADTRTGTELLIVDNSEERWKVSTYLREWCEISKRFDIATGHLEIGGLLALHNAWQKVDELRILMGDSTTLRTKQAFITALNKLQSTLDASLESEKQTNHFLSGVPAIVEGLRQGKIRCKVYRKDRFHAKAYITHARSAVVGAFALVGSSNLSWQGLNDNVELNVQIVGPPVTPLQEWFENYWEQAEDVSPEFLKTIERHVVEYSPFDVYVRALHEYFRGHELTAEEWETTRSRMFGQLDHYQKEGYWALLKIARQHGGAFLCDGVGLGKTFIGLMLIERLIVHERKNVVLFAPKAAREGVWDPHLKRWLPELGRGHVFSNLAVFNHTDLGRGGDYPDMFRRVTEQADVVIVDEAHHFRNPGRRGSEPDGSDASRYYKLFDLLDGSIRPKQLFLLTATPINNRLADFRHLAELFTRQEPAYFARTLAIPHLPSHFNALENSFRKQVGSDAPDAAEHIDVAQQLLSADTIFRELVVQRSRAYARESQMREHGKSSAFPDRKPPQVAEYSIRKTYGRLLEIFEQAFQRQNPLFTLPIYYPLAWYKGSDASIDPFEENRQKQVVGLIRTQFLKRFESSVRAFELSCERLLKNLLAFLEKNVETDSEKRLLERWKHQNAEIIGYMKQHELDLWGDAENSEASEDIVSPELLARFEKLDRNEFKVDEMLDETYLDLANITKFLDETKKFQPKHDDKLQKLIRLLKSKDLANEKVLIFTEFADTARYIASQLTGAGIDGVAEVDSGSKANRASIIRRFAPYYNGSSSSDLKTAGETEIRVLVSTDVLSEGLNLQDAARMINYDIHWNPVRLMQRIGRVDRRMDPSVEEQLIADHPEVKPSRGAVTFWNFLPPDELNQLLSLYTKVTQKTLLISRTLGIEGKKLLRPEDDYDALKEFNHSYEGSKSITEVMRSEYQQLLDADPALLAHIQSLPGATFSGRDRVKEGVRGVFFCYALPALDREKGEFTEAAGTVRWYLYDTEHDGIFGEPSEILGSIRSTPATPRVCRTEKPMLSDIRKRIEKHIKDTYLKKIDAPQGVRPSLKCWMELSESA